jgi:hypothetical protein
MKKQAIIVTPEFRVSYPNVFKARKNDMNGKDEYSIVALFKKGEDLSKLKAAAEEAMAKKFGADKKKWPKNFKTPFRDQGEKEKTADDGSTFLPEGYVAGAIFMNLRSQRRPIVVDRQRNEITPDREEDFYPGCYARANISCYAYDTAGNKGVAFGLSMVQKLRDGEPFSGRPKVEEAFEALADEEDGDVSGKDSVF